MSRIDAPPILPYDLAVWYPLLRGPLRCDSVVRVAHTERAFRSKRPLWSDLAAGAARVVVLGEPATSGARAVRTLLRPDPVRRELNGLPDGYSAERFHALRGTGGGYVLLPAADPRGYRAGIELLPTGRAKWRAAKRILRAAQTVGWSTPPGAASVAVIRRRDTRLEPVAAGDADEPDANAAHDTPYSMRGTLAGVASGVPGRNQKITLLLAATRGLPARYVKLSKSRASQRQVQREIDALAKISDVFPALGLAPRLIDDGERGGSTYFVQEALDGGRSGDVVGNEHIEFLTRVCRRTLSRAPLSAIARYARDRDDLRELEASTDAEWCATFGELRRAIEAFFGREHIPIGFAHGDFTPWNLRVWRGRLRAFDWEYFDDGAPALHDLFHFIVQTGILVRRMSAQQLIDETRSVLAGIAKPLVNDALLRSDHALGALALYVLHAAVADERLNQIEPPPFEQVDWLRRTRIDLARLITRELDAMRAGTRRPEWLEERAA